MAEVRQSPPEATSDKTRRQTPSMTKPDSSKKSITRRDFLRGALVTGLGLLVKGDPSPPPTETKKEIPTPETKPAESPPPTPEVESPDKGLPLVVDFPPLQKALVEKKEENLLAEETPPFKLSELFNRLTGSSYDQLEKEYQEEVKKGWPLPGESGIKWLLENNHEKEAVCLALAHQWSLHGVSAAQAMRNFREQQNKPVVEQRLFVDGVEAKPGQHTAEEIFALLQQGKAENRNVVIKEPSTIHPIEPYHLLSLPDYIASLEKGDKVDEWGNPYYYLTIDHHQLAAALKNTPQKVINCSFNFGKVPIRLGHRLPEEGETENKSKGWIGGEYAGTPESSQEGMVKYSPPAIAIETAYKDPENLQALQEFAEALSDKIIVLAAGNSGARLPKDFKLPPNCVLVAAWNSKKDKPEHDFLGNSDQVLYLDPSNVTTGRFSSLSTAIVAEWLSQQKITDTKSLKDILARHSKIQQETGHQVLDFGALPIYPNEKGIPAWDNPEKYRPAWE